MLGMDLDAPHPRCPFCGMPMQFKRTSPNYGARDPLHTFDCSQCNAILNIAPEADGQMAIRPIVV
jgi:hypothetical protein